MKSSLLLSDAPVADRLLYPEAQGAASLWRLRLEPRARLDEGVALEGAYETRVALESPGAALGGAEVLGAAAPAPYRLAQLDGVVAQAPPAYAWRQEIDRAFAALQTGRTAWTVGRQAVGWGRGVLFGAVDLFAPFTPLEADREWRRGIDAVRGEVRAGERSSADAVAAFGERWSESAFGVRLRGYAGDADGEIVLGRRAQDLFAGLTGSAAVRGAEVHFEAALFKLPEALPDPGPFADPTLVPKAVVGGSYQLRLGSGLSVLAEYHFSGFGVPDPKNLVLRLLDPAFENRYARGDFQILGRHAVAALAAYEVGPELSLAATWVASPTDSSGVAAPSITWTLSEAASVVATAYWGYGSPPRGRTLWSEYGGTPRAAFVQIRLVR